MSESDSLIGKMLDEYRLETLLGIGGMARVYRAMDTNTQRYVAIKVIDLPHHAQADYIRRFELEARAVGQLTHPNIVTLYRYAQADGLPYIAMQFIEGATLRNIINGYKRDGEFIETHSIRRIVRQIAHALDYAHQNGIIHRDVTAHNIMIDHAGNAYLMDFGLVLITSVGTYGQAFGTPYYVAPEQAMSSATAIPQSDLYSLGIVTYEMLASQLPFTASDPLDIVMKHMSETPPSLRVLRPSISPELERVVMKALSKDPKDRYQTGVLFANALDSVLRIKASPTKYARTITNHVSEMGHTLPPIPTPVSANVAPTRPKTPQSAPAPIPIAPSRSKVQFRWKYWYWAGAIGMLVVIWFILSQLSQ